MCVRLLGLHFFALLDLAGTGLCVALKEYRSAVCLYLVCVCASAHLAHLCVSFLQTAVGVASTFDREGHIHRLLGPNCHANICSALDSLVIAGGSYMTAFPFVIGAQHTHSHGLASANRPRCVFLMDLRKHLGFACAG